MAICPKCGEEIDYLKNYQSGENCYKFDGEKYETDEFFPDSGANDYECPMCCEVLFIDEDDARKFLLGS